MKFSFENVIEDFAQLQEDYAFSSKLYKRNKKYFVIIGPICIGIVGSFESLINGIELFPLVAISTIAIVWLLVASKFFKYITLRRIKFIMNESDLKAFVGKKEIELNEVEMTIIAGESHSKIKWNKFIKMSETNKYIFLYFTSLSAIIIPKDRIIPIEQAKEILEYIQNRYNTHCIGGQSIRA